MKKNLLSICLIWLLALALMPAAARTHDITIDDYFTLAAVSELALSPDGRQVAYTESRWDKPDEGRQTAIWIVSTGRDPRPRRLAFAGSNVDSLCWSADSARLYFLAKNKRAGEKEPPFDGTTQVWQLSLQGGDPAALTAVAGGVEAMAIAANESMLFYAVEKSTIDEDDFGTLRARFDKPQYQGGKRTVSEIWRLDLRSWRAEKIVAEKRYIRSFAATADGRRLAMISAFDDSVVKSEGESRLDIWEGGEVITPSTAVYRAGASTPWAWLESLAWSADGRRIAFCAVFDGHPNEIFIGKKSGGEWKMERMPRPASVHIQGYGALKWHPSGQLFFVALVSARTVVVPADAAVLESLAKAALPDRIVYDFDIAANGRTGVYVMGQSQQFPEIYAGEFKAGAALRRLTSLNPQTETWKLPQVKLISWKGDDGVAVQGILELPAGYRPGTRLPLVVGIHGGPTAAVLAALDFNLSLGRTWLPARGYAVLCPNYRGSTGSGDSVPARPQRQGERNRCQRHRGRRQAADRGWDRRPRTRRRHGLEQRRLPDQLFDHEEGPAFHAAGGQQRRRHRRYDARMGHQRRAGLPRGAQDRIALGSAGHLQEHLAQLRPGQCHHAHPHPCRRKGRALSPGQQPPALPRPQGVPKDPDGIDHLPRRAPRLEKNGEPPRQDGVGPGLV